jgi:flavodoxin I
MFLQAKINKNMQTIKIIYGTGGGNTQLVCEQIQKFIAENSEFSEFNVILERAELADITQVNNSDVLILACPTYGEGILEPACFNPFFRKIQSVDFTNKKVAVIGLGDPKYGLDYCLESANILEKFFKDKQANIVVHGLRIAKSPIPLLDTMVKKWTEKLLVKLTALSQT